MSLRAFAVAVGGAFGAGVGFTLGSGIAWIRLIAVPTSFPGLEPFGTALYWAIAGAACAWATVSVRRRLVGVALAGLGAAFWVAVFFSVRYELAGDDPRRLIDPGFLVIAAPAGGIGLLAGALVRAIAESQPGHIVERTLAVLALLFAGSVLGAFPYAISDVQFAVNTVVGLDAALRAREEHGYRIDVGKVDSQFTCLRIRRADGSIHECLGALGGTAEAGARCFESSMSDDWRERCGFSERDGP